THANPASFHPVQRNKSDHLLKALADSGGILGCSLYPFLIGGRDVTLEAFCDMMARTVDLMGVDQVGIGSDLVRKCTDDYLAWMRMGRWTQGVDYGAGGVGQTSWPLWQDWFQSPVDFPTLATGLRTKGFSEEETAKLMGENWLRFFDEAFQEGS
ncbi:MAG: membrane dipeptidase, partial [Chloroflexota bacterium]